MKRNYALILLIERKYSFHSTLHHFNRNFEYDSFNAGLKSERIILESRAATTHSPVLIAQAYSLNAPQLCVADVTANKLFFSCIGTRRASHPERPNRKLIANRHPRGRRRRGAGFQFASNARAQSGRSRSNAWATCAHTLDAT